jgi:pimeloyl-ACP methyl ester carboxylesterase
MYCTVRGTKAYYEEIGRGRPIINLHGWPSEHGQMLQMMEPLFEQRHGWRRIYLDLPGMGRTPGPEWLTRHDQMLDFVAEFTELMTDEAPLLVGHSYGAQLVQGLLQRCPHRCTGALLLSPGWTEAAEGEVAPVVFGEDPAFLNALDVERSFLDLFVVRTLPVLDIVRSQSVPGFLGADYEFLARIEQGPEFTYREEAPKPFEGPVLVCSGRQDPAGYRRISALLDRFPRGTLAILDRAGHLLFADQPDLFRHLASEWLDRAAEHTSADLGATRSSSA